MIAAIKQRPSKLCRVAPTQKLSEDCAEVKLPLLAFAAKLSNVAGATGSSTVLPSQCIRACGRPQDLLNQLQETELSRTI